MPYLDTKSGYCKTKSRCSTLTKYNDLAPCQNPLCPILQYSDVIDYTCLGDFILLKYSCHDILGKPWANSSYRETATKYFKTCCAQEELTRLNVEVEQLAAWVEHED